MFVNRMIGPLTVLFLADHLAEQALVRADGGTVCQGLQDLQCLQDTARPAGGAHQT